MEIALRTANNQLCILLGIPTEQLRPSWGTGQSRTRLWTWPSAFLQTCCAAGRMSASAERLAAAQCAQIGVAVSAFYPHISINGTIDYQASRFKNLFKGQALSGSVGPSFQWDILAIRADPQQRSLARRHASSNLWRRISKRC